MFLIRGIVFSHEAVRDWETKLTPALAESLRRRRRGKAGGVPRMWGYGDAGDMTGQSIAGWGIVDGVGLALG
jgi:hypothetical protein